MREYIITEHPDFPYEEPKPQTLIRCKDCKCRNSNGYCTKFQWNYYGIKTKLFMPYDNDFCSYAERKEE